jgi:hypothetical protein
VAAVLILMLGSFVLFQWIGAASSCLASSTLQSSTDCRVSAADAMPRDTSSIAAFVSSYSTVIGSINSGASLAGLVIALLTGWAVFSAGG